MWKIVVFFKTNLTIIWITLIKLICFFKLYLLQDDLLKQAIESMQRMEKTQLEMQSTLTKMVLEQHNVCLSLMALTNAYIEVHKKEHPNVEQFHLSLPSSQ